MLRERQRISRVTRWSESAGMCVWFGNTLTVAGLHIEDGGQSPARASTGRRDVSGLVIESLVLRKVGRENKSE